MAIDYDPQEYIAALGNIGSGLNNKPGESFGVVDNLNNINRSFGNPFMSFTPTTDPTFTSGLNYARSIAGGQNVPNMIAPGVSYSAANPQGFTQLDLPPIVSDLPNIVTETPPDDPSFLGTGIGGVNIPVDRKQDLPPRDIFSLLNIGKLFDGTFDFSNFDFGTTPDLPPDIQETIPVIPPKPPSIGGVGGRDIEDRILIDERIELPPIDQRRAMPPNMLPPKINDQLFIDDMPRFIDEELFDPKEVIQGPVGMPVPINIGGPVDLPGMGGPSMLPIPPQGPVGMSPQETAKMSSQQELSNLISNKDILQEIPADDGVRNQYQVELDEFINKSPINMDTYKEELPIGSAINLGIPSIMETVVPMAVPGLGLAKNISDSLNSNNNPSPAPRPSTPSTPSFTPGIDYSSVRRFGR